MTNLFTKVLTATLVLTYLNSGLAKESTGGGNPDYCEQKDGVCERVDFRVSNRHPEHDTLLGLIKNAKLPKNMKNEMIRDLEQTQVIYSGEKVSYEDLAGRYEMQLVGITKETLLDEDGEITGYKEIEEWRQVYTLPKLGIFLNADGPGYDTGDLKNVFVRAVTQLDPRKVIYFTHWLEDQSADELMKLVLHEQGHRLETLKAFRHDERIVEGWAKELLAYLKGQVSEESFYKTMRAYKLNTEDRLLFGERKRLSGNTYYADIPVVLTQDDIQALGSTKSYEYLLSVSKNAFKDYKGLDRIDQVISIPTTDVEGLENIDSYFAPILESGEKKSIELRVVVRNEINRPEIGGLAVQDVVESIGASPRKLTEILEIINDLNSLHFPYAKSSYNKAHLPSVIFSAQYPDFRANLLTIGKELKKALDRLQVSQPFAYQALYEDYFSQKPFEVSARIHHQSSIEGHIVKNVVSGQRTTVDNSEMRIYVSPRSTAHELSLAAYNFVDKLAQGVKDSADKVELKTLNQQTRQLLREYGVENINFKMHSLAQIPAARRLLSNKQAVGYAQCLHSAITESLEFKGQVTLALSGSDNALSWKLSALGNNVYSIVISIPHDLALMGEAEAAVKYLKKSVLTGTYLTRGRYYVGSNANYTAKYKNSAEWYKRKTRRHKFRIASTGGLDAIDKLRRLRHSNDVRAPTHLKHVADHAIKTLNSIINICN